MTDATDARLAAHRNAGTDQGVNIAVDGPNRDLKRVGQLRRGADRPRAKCFHQGEQAVGAARHADTTVAGGGVQDALD